MKRILVIEDDDAHRHMLTAALKGAHYEIREAPDGEKGCELYRQNPCDLIITDIFMPEKEGLEVILDLKAEFPEVKIMAISGGGYKSNFLADEILNIAKDLGADTVMSKPIKIQALRIRVKEIIGN